MKKDIRVFGVSLTDEDVFGSYRHVDVQCPLHINLPMEIVLCEEGVLTMEIGEKTVTVPPGSAAFVLPLEVHSFRTETHSVCRVLIVGEGAAEPFLRFTRENTPVERVFSVSPDLFSYVIKNAGSAGNEVEIFGIVMPLCAEIMKKCTFRQGMAPYQDVFLEAVRAVDECYREKISLSFVARKLGVHPVTVSRIFRENAGLTFVEYVTYRRILFALRLLSSEKCRVTEAAYAAGFGSLRSFHRAFARHVGMSPAAWRAAGCPRITPEV